MCTCTFIGIAPLDFDFPAASMLLESVYLLQEMILKKTMCEFPQSNTVCGPKGSFWPCPQLEWHLKVFLEKKIREA